ncbi:hypothetical protein RJ55_06861 [Drechmeria coniospora]|nr:hypothetical protein RJ55_06861 [Drechmeria coniospora]
MHPTLASLIFAIFSVSVLSTKLLRLYLNAHSFSAVAFVIFLPIFVLPDAVLICSEWLFLRRKNGTLPFMAFAVACLISLITFFAATSQLSFFWQTGGEIEWSDAASFALHGEGRKVLLSGSGTAIVVSGVILAISWTVQTMLYRAVGILLVTVEDHLVSIFRWTLRKLGWEAYAKQGDESFLPLREYVYDSDSDSDDTASERTLPVGGGNLTPDRPMTRRCLVSWGVAIAALVTFVGNVLIFDPDRPYGRVLTTLPLPLLDTFKTKHIACSGSAWPLPELIQRQNWELPEGYFKGWAPGLDNHFARTYRERRPAWLPRPVPSGFSRWDPETRRLMKDNANGSSSPTTTAALHDGSSSTLAHDGRCPEPVVDDPFYNPVNDPMKISNLANDLLQPLRETLESVDIKHIALIQMESMREELFPLRHGSDFHRLIMKSHDELDYDATNDLLSRLTVNTEKLTGMAGNFKSRDGQPFTRKSTEWNDTTDAGFGGINIVGAHTTSSVSTKSTAAIHCGIWPMPVDMFEESESQNYQPCIPQILELFNSMKQNSSGSDYRHRQWYPAFFQSVTDRYDRQDVFDSRIGFKHIVTKARIEEDGSKNSGLEEINYFGYPEPVLKRYLRDYIAKATADDQRMFLSHFTSTTHHPWATPKSFKTLDYMGSAHGGLTDSHKDMNKYLNTIRWNDAWLGDLMQMLDDHGIANETLVVLVGDHGQAFSEDFQKTGTYENGHISNFRVPITFRHPHIPRVQHVVNATSISIIPTILDLLISTGSLNKQDTAAASDLIQDFEGQSLIRPYKTTYNGRRAWNFGIVNPGGRMLSVTSADAPWRLVLPLDGKTEYVFSDMGKDPLELDRMLRWSMNSLVSEVRRKYGEGAATWLAEAEPVARWWGMERKRLWQYEEK